METSKKFTYEEAQEYIRSKNRKRMTFYCNIQGWDMYYTLAPTFATPTGKLKEFPRKKQISLKIKSPRNLCGKHEILLSASNE